MRVLAAYMANFEEEDSTYTLLQPDPDELEGRIDQILEGDLNAIRLRR
jgi:hypothetical protein